MVNFRRKSLWEILVPNCDNLGNKYDLEHHYEWDSSVRDIAGGLTILKKTKGQWINPEGKLFPEEMIPVRIYCTRKNISDIVDMTIKHYSQEAVLAYKLSSNRNVIYRFADEKSLCDKCIDYFKKKK
ncbi:MAG: hypothetical protein ACP5N1_06680 [Candidatus Woesearchaeota archaeon]